MKKYLLIKTNSDAKVCIIAKLDTYKEAKKLLNAKIKEVRGKGFKDGYDLYETEDNYFRYVDAFHDILYGYYIYELDL